MQQRDYAAIFKSRITELVAEIGDGSPERFAAELRLPARNVTRYVKGEHQPRLPEAIRIAERAGVSLDWLAGLSDRRGGGGFPGPEHLPALEPDESAETPRRPRSRRGSPGAR